MSQCTPSLLIDEEGTTKVSTSHGNQFISPNLFSSKTFFLSPSKLVFVIKRTLDVGTRKRGGGWGGGPHVAWQL